MDYGGDLFGNFIVYFRKGSCENSRNTKRNEGNKKTYKGEKIMLLKNELKTKIAERIRECCDRLYGFGSRGQTLFAEEEEQKTIRDIIKLIKEEDESK